MILAEKVSAYISGGATTSVAAPVVTNHLAAETRVFESSLAKKRQMDVVNDFIPMATDLLRKCHEDRHDQRNRKGLEGDCKRR